MTARAVVAILLCSACKDKGGVVDSGGTLFGPDLAHTPPDGVHAEGAPLVLDVTASDPQGVHAVVVYHRVTDGAYWDLTALEAGDGDTWTVALDGITAPGMEYYFKATDSGDPRVDAELPADGEMAPFSVEVQPMTRTLPWTEDFEPSEEGESASLFTLGWWTPSDAFNGYPWAITESQASSGGQAAWHSRGAEGAGELADWMISPPLDLSTLPAAMVTWQERGATITNLEEHGLYISVGSRDPALGDFVAVEAALPAPDDDDWGRSAAYDLSEWAGSPVAYLAWFYRGTAADDWLIDDVQVRALSADIEASLTWSPDPVQPGETATLVVTLDNATDADADDVVATLSLPDGGGELASDTYDVGTLAAGDVAPATFELALDAALDNHRYLPLALSVTDGVDTWDFDLQMTVGLPSTGVVSLEIDTAASVEVVLGRGDVDAPDVEVTVWNGNLAAGEHSLSVDMTDEYALLPPGPGPERWWARVDTAATGRVNGVDITFGGETDSATRLPSLDGENDALVYVPEPPSPSLTSMSPDEASPGESGIALTLTMRNDGATTSGPVTGRIVSADPGVTVVSGAEFTLDADVWSASEMHTFSGPVIDISANHVDSTPVELDIELDDGLESWTLQGAVDVPWPVFKVVRVTIDDDGGDGILDPGESAALEIELANTGDVDSSGPVYGTLRLASSSSADATIDAGDDARFGSIDVDRTRDADEFQITSNGGSVGDTLDLVLDIYDSDYTYTSEVQLVLGEPPWFMMSSADDAQGDNLDGYGFDFVNGRYRIVDGEVQMSLQSAEPYDSSTLFIEAWGLSGGADWTLYRWVLQSGVGTFQGYDGGWTTISTLGVDFASSDELVLSWPVEDMGLAVNSFSIGLAAGWCGPDEYFCDHFPDGWGYPYVSYSPTYWHEVSW